MFVSFNLFTFLLIISSWLVVPCLSTVLLDDDYKYFIPHKDRKKDNSLLLKG